MADVRVFGPGGYRFVKAGFQYSAGVAAQPGFAIERARFAQPRPLAEGFEAIAAHLRQRGLPLAALCATELRSPAPFTETGFVAFNRTYVQTLQQWGLFDGEANPVARTNVCPLHQPPAQPAIYAFSYTVPVAGHSGSSFVIAGSGEAPEGHANYRDVSADALRDKLRFVMAEMARRMQALGHGWADALASQAYTVHDIGALVGPEVVQHGAAAAGLTWHFTRPPIVDLEVEMDARRVFCEWVVA